MKGERVKSEGVGECWRVDSWDGYPTRLLPNFLRTQVDTCLRDGPLARLAIAMDNPG